MVELETGGVKERSAKLHPFETCLKGGVIDEPPSYILLRWVSQTLLAMLARQVLRFYFVFQVGEKVDAKLKTFTGPDPDRYAKLESVK